MAVRPDSFGMTLLLAGLASMAPLALDTYVPALPQMTAEFGVDAATGQLTLTVFLIGNALGMVAFGPLADRFGRRRIGVFGILGCVVASGLCTLAGTIGVLLVGRFLQAVGAAASQVIARAVVRDLYSGHRAARELAFITMLTATVPTAAPILGAWLQELFEWRASFFMVMGFSMMVLGGVWFGLDETRPADSGGAASPRAVLAAYLPLLRDRSIALPLLTGISFCGVFGWMSIGSYLLQDVYGTSPVGYAVAGAICMLGLIAGSYVSPAIAGRIGSGATAFLGCWVMFAGGALLFAAWITGTSDLLTTVIAQCVFLVGMALARPQWQAVYLQLHPQRAGVASAALGFAQMTVSTALVTVVAVVLGAGAGALACSLLGAVLLCLALQIAVRDIVRL